MVNHDQHVLSLHSDKYCLNIKINHGPTLHCDKYSLDMKINHGQAWSTIGQHHIVRRIVSIWKSTTINHVYISVYNIYLRVYIPWVLNISPLSLILFNHGPTSHCDKDSLNMKINHGQAWSNVTFWQGL